MTRWVTTRVRRNSIVPEVTWNVSALAGGPNASMAKITGAVHFIGTNPMLDVSGSSHAAEDSQLG